MLQPWRNGIVKKIINETENTKRFWIEVPAIENFDFEPGQFVTLDLPIHEKRNKRWRSYSIASAPDGTNIFELIIVHLKDGIGTTYLFNEIQVGDEILLRGPQGIFTLPKVLDKNLYLICTGTGIAPFRSMVHHIKNQNISFKKVFLLFGTRFIKDGLYIDELNELQTQLSGFEFIPVFSREQSNLVHTGYVHKYYEELLKKYNEPSQFYLCGWKNMVDEAKNRIIELGFDKKDIHLELYG